VLRYIIDGRLPPQPRPPRLPHPGLGHPRPSRRKDRSLGHQALPAESTPLPTQIAALPESFLRGGFLHYFLKHYSHLVEDYSQQQLAQASLSLKNSYSTKHFAYLQRANHFDFALVVLSKTLKYFLAARFPVLSLPNNLEALIYVSSVQTVLGYSVDPHTYEVIEAKLHHRKKRVNR
jgi:hypothetical protein